MKPDRVTAAVMRQTDLPADAAGRVRERRRAAGRCEECGGETPTHRAACIVKEEMAADARRRLAGMVGAAEVRKVVLLSPHGPGCTCEECE